MHTVVRRKRRGEGHVRLYGGVWYGTIKILGQRFEFKGASRSEVLRLVRAKAAEWAIGPRGGGRPRPPDRPRYSENDGWIYFLYSPAFEAIKIGFAKNVASRLKAYRLHHPEDLVLLGTIAGSIQNEQALHERFRDHLIRGEWFRDTPAIRSLIDRQE
jgi:hypothetical protein